VCARRDLYNNASSCARVIDMLPGGLTHHERRPTMGFGATASNHGPAMSVRELIALGTGSQVPTRQRNHNGYFLRWDDEGFLFDPGEGTQRQMTHGSIAASAIHRVCVTHFHGDHCLGLAGIVQRLSLDRCDHPVSVHYPASGQQYFDRLFNASIYHCAFTCVPCPVPERTDTLIELASTERYTLFAHALDHGDVPSYGYRVEEREGRRFVPEQLAAAGVSGPMVQQLAREGTLDVSGRTVSLDEVSVPRPGAVFAFVMDTRPCAGAVALARDADLLVMEATFTAADHSLADKYAHSTSVGAALTARDAGARALALTHFSQRYSSTEQHVAEAREVFAATSALRDLDHIAIPRRK
jgi:ribonuclease Z